MFRGCGLQPKLNLFFDLLAIGKIGASLLSAEPYASVKLIYLEPFLTGFGKSFSFTSLTKVTSNFAIAAGFVMITLYGLFVIQLVICKSARKIKTDWSGSATNQFYLV